MERKLCLVQVAALGWNLVNAGAGDFDDLRFRPMETVFPALTCPFQATMRTATSPSQHGIVMNGIYRREFRRPSFWEQSSALVTGDRIWGDFRAAGGTVGMLFWQQSLGEDVDVLLSPWPIHKHHGGLVDLTHSKPAGLYDDLCSTIGRTFNLANYWGPLAKPKVGDWIADATAHVIRSSIAPDMLFTYLPTLDYDLQRFPEGHVKCGKSMSELWKQLAVIHDAARENDYDLIVVGDYAIGDVSTIVYPNRMLRYADLLSVRHVEGMTYPNVHESAAFAVVDHELAHVYVHQPSKMQEVKACLLTLGKEVDILDRDAQAALGIDHPEGGDFVLRGTPGTWFAYPWWDDPKEAPDYATHIDIHNKPGYDPCELFFGWNPFKVPTDCSLVRGSHGLAGKDRTVAFASTLDFESEPATVMDLAKALKHKLNS